MRKSTKIWLGVTVAATVGTPCAIAAFVEEPEYAAVCVDQNENRVDDDQCDEDDDGSSYHGYHGGTHWMYIHNGSYAPRIGERVRGGTSTPPSSGFVRGGVSREGGTVDGKKAATSGGKSVTRGGFGGSGKSGG